MATTDLLNAVLPPEGWYCIVGLKQEGRPKQIFVETIAEAEAEIATLVTGEYDVYFACAKYENDEDGRTQKNSKYFKSFWVDIDCGIDKDLSGKGYLDQATGLVELKKFCEAVALPTPTVVNSGRGVHAYWRLTETIGRAEWKPVADRLKALCEEHKFRADPSRTAESASILRVPETFNYKQDPPLSVSIMQIEPETSYEDIKMAIGVLIAPDYIPKQTSAMAQAALSNRQSRFKTILMKTTEGKGCAQLENIAINQEDIEEPLWRAGLSIAAHCVDRDEAIHIISQNHPSYSSAETEKKALQTKGPYTCSSFEKLHPQGCKECPHKGKISSPILLGSEIIASAPDIAVIAETPRGEKHEFVIPEFPFPYFRGQNGGVYRQPVDEDDEATLIYEHDLYVVKRLKDPSKGDVIWLRLHLPQDGVREFAIAQTEAQVVEKLRERLSWHGVAGSKKQMDAIMAYIITFIKHLQFKGKVEMMRTQFGWAENDSKFILGDREISAGKVSYSPPSHATGSLANWMTPTGSMEDWLKIVNVYNQPEFEPHAFGFFTAFGAPLIKHLNLKGAIINLVNNTSGTGKSTVLKMCNSVYGHPEELMLQWKDTMNSMVHRLGIMNNLPVTIDEITKLSGDNFSDLAYSISQGRGKNRMMQHDNAERINATKWGTIALCSSNAYFYDKLAALKATPDGEFMRLLEYRIEVTEALSKEEADTIFNGLYSNYGLAGEPYVQYLVDNLEDAIDTVIQVQQKLDKEVKFTSRERFWSATAACNIAGALMAKDLGLLGDFDIGRVYRWLVKELENMRSDVKAPSATNQASIIGEFMNQHRAATLVINGRADARSGMEQLPIVEPKFNDLFVRIEPDDKRLYINAKQLRTYCTKQQINLKEILKGLETDGIYLGKVKKRLSKGTKLSSPPIDAFVFSLEVENFLDAETYIEAAKNAPDVDPQTLLQS
jgi:energy-coupling factor transporter ATP-binding protein EcfA2